MRALDDFGKAAEQVPGPSQVGATAPETPYSNSPTQPLPQCCRNARSHSQELRAAAQVTGALFTPPSHTRDACWDVLIVRSHRPDTGACLCAMRGQSLLPAVPEATRCSGGLWPISDHTT